MKALLLKPNKNGCRHVLLEVDSNLYSGAGDGEDSVTPEDLHAAGIGYDVIDDIDAYLNAHPELNAAVSWLRQRLEFVARDGIATFVEDLVRRGIGLRLDGDFVNAKPWRNLTDVDLTTLRARKAEVVAYLRAYPLQGVVINNDQPH
jgi:hypothetical protein